MLGRNESRDVDSEVSVDEHRRQYERIEAELQGMPPEDLTHHLPNLVDEVVRASTDLDGTVRFVVGVSFTPAHTPLDYRLDRVYEAGDRTRVESLKDAVSGQHRYLQFGYPADPYFDAGALRGALLEAIERELDALASEGQLPESNVNSLWKHLAGDAE